MDKTRKNQKGFSLIELLIVIIISLIILAIAVPNMLAARRAANEGSAITTLRTLHGAQSIYHASTGNGDYAGTNSTTGDTVGLATLENANLIDNVLGNGTKSGYKFVGAISLRGATTPASFFFSANPGSPSGFSQTGTRRFAITQTGTIGFDYANIGIEFNATTAPFAPALED